MAVGLQTSGDRSTERTGACPTPLRPGGVPVPPAAHLPALDGLRALAALAVVLCHYWQEVFPLGGLGVDLFFVLSGFLITRIVLDHGRGPRFLLHFYARRNLRIWPIYYLSLAFVIAVTPHLSFQRLSTEGYL